MTHHKNIVPTLINPYAAISMMSSSQIREAVSTGQIDKATYGIYCEALQAVRQAIRDGATIGDLETALASIDPEAHRLKR